MIFAAYGYQHSSYFKIYPRVNATFISMLTYYDIYSMLLRSPSRVVRLPVLSNSWLGQGLRYQ